MDKSGIAILGLDHWYAAFDAARQISTSKAARLAAVTHDDAAKAEAFSREYGAPFFSTDYRAALDQPGVDIVVTLYSVNRNVEVCREAAARGKHIISVKPMAMDLAGADEIIRAVRAAGVHFFPLDCIGRLSPDRIRLKQWIGEGRIGQVVRFNHSMASTLPQEWPGGEHNGGWWIDPARAPGGGWIDHAIYAIDAARWLTDSEPVSVAGYVANMRHPHLKMEDYGVATFTLANGAVVVIEDTWTSEPGNFLNRNEIIGSAGVIFEDSGAWGGRTAIRGNFGFDGWTIVERAREPVVEVVDHVVACIDSGQTLVASIDDGRNNLAYCLAFYQAARSGTRLAIGGQRSGKVTGVA
jgi:predicted dehydrogenase